MKILLYLLLSVFLILDTGIDKIEAAAEEVPTKEAPEKEAPVEESPAEEAPADEVPDKEEPEEEEPKWSDENQDVIHLTDDTFDEFIKTNPVVFVMFYAPWCGYCQQAKPIYAEAARMVNIENQADGKLTAVDCVAHEALCKKFNVGMYPTGKYFKDGKDEFNYNHGMTAEDVVEFMKNPTPPEKDPEMPEEEEEKPWPEENQDVVHLTGETFKEFAESESAMLVMFYAPWCGHCKNMKPNYAEAAKVINTNDEFPGKLAAVDCIAEENKELCENYKVEGFPDVRYFNNGKVVEKFEEVDRSTENLIAFMKKQVDPNEQKASNVDELKEGKDEL